MLDEVHINDIVRSYLMLNFDFNRIWASLCVNDPKRLGNFTTDTSFGWCNIELSLFVHFHGKTSVSIKFESRKKIAYFCGMTQIYKTFLCNESCHAPYYSRTSFQDTSKVANPSDPRLVFKKLVLRRGCITYKSPKLPRVPSALGGLEKFFLIEGTNFDRF